MTARVEVDPVLVSCSVRYALGRHSYLPGLVADEVRRTWPELGEQRTVIREDIARWLEQMGTSDYVMGAGWSTARPTWEQLLRWIDTRNASDVKDACPRCGSTKPSRRFSSDNGRTHCGHGWHFAPLDPEEAEMRADQIHDGPLDGTRLSAEGRPMAEPIKRHGPFVRENDGLWESYVDGNYIADHATRTEALAALGIAEDRGPTHTQNKENER